MWTIVTGLFDAGPFIPHGHCYLWQPGLVWLHLLSDIAIAISYYSIPLILFHFIRQRQDIPFNWLFILFGAFILACGTTHLMSIWTLWHPTYWLSGSLKLLTALVSLYTAVALVITLPKLLALPSLARAMAERLKLLDVLDASLNEIYMFDPQTLRFEYVNAGAIHNTGYSFDQMLTLTVPEIKSELNATTFQQLIAPLRQHQQERLKLETVHQRANRTSYPVESHLQLIEQADKSVILAIVMDITERKRAELALREQAERERLMRTIAQRIHQSLSLSDVLDTTVAEVRRLLQADRVLVYQFAADRSGTIVAESVATEWTSALGCMIEDTCFQTGGNNYRWDKKIVITDVSQARLSDCHLSLLTQFEVKADLVVPILPHAEQGEVNPQLWGLLIVHHCSAPHEWNSIQLDLVEQLGIQLAIAIQQASAFEQAQTELIERQQIEVRLRATLNEKEILLKEIHHRVKNNLQIVSGLIQLQVQTLDHPEVIEALRESQRRVESMSLIHKKLYAASDFGQVDVSDYIHSLVTNLLAAYQLSPESIAVRINIEPVILSLDQAIPCGLIVNELISNALKHAFPEREGEISITLRPVGTNDLELIIQDNGIGLSTEINWQNSTSLGLSLVYDLATEQLDGTLSVQTFQGTTFKIKFPTTPSVNRISNHD